MNQKEIGKKIKSIRKSQGLTREEFAKKLDVSVYTVANYEQGQRGSNTRVLNKIAQALGVSIEELLIEKNKNEMQTFANSWNDKSEEERNLISNKVKENWEEEKKETVINTIVNIADASGNIEFFLNDDNTINYEKSKEMFDFFVHTMNFMCNFPKK
ncbi:helix-turn-helix transcriptional regulator [uncultured Clostridium sp.]|uniref:helix-turn-helix domain-containing protein n=1 Tax=uncultured Clostridium sp. TaxID=59620 RepID=UPI0026078D97|nr:helix-turn-helix transcriptional regulator [uncultured Clostridium sp.]